MITESEMYWLTRLDYIQGFLFIFGLFFSFVITLILVVVAKDCHDAKPYYKNAKKLSLAGVFFILLIIGGLFIPTTKEYAAIKLIPMVVNDEDVQQLPDKVVDLANDWLDELKPKNILQENKNDN